MDSQFEEELSRNPYSLKIWLAYIDTKRDQPGIMRYTVFERAISFLPRSYKLWKAYLNDRTIALRNANIRSRKYELLIDTFERALVYLNKMPTIWLEYCSLLQTLNRGTQTRKTFDRALQALPITQHRMIWEKYVDWARRFGVPQTAVRVFRRYLMFEPGYREEYIDYLEEVGQYHEAARQLVLCLNDPSFTSANGQTQHHMWMHLCDMCAKHPAEVVGAVNVEALIRDALSKFSDEVGRLWTCLADFYLRRGQFEKARDVYEEALRTVPTVRDFTLIFDAYIKVEETIVTAKIRIISEDEEAEEAEEPENNRLTAQERKDEESEISLRLARIEYLLEQRPLLVNAVVLRQNPLSVHEWQKRARLYQKLSDWKKVAATYEEAVQAIQPADQALGKLSTVYLAWANFYEKHSSPPDVQKARRIYERAVDVSFKNVEELATVYCAFGEFLLRHEAYDEALSLLQQATDPQFGQQKVQQQQQLQASNRRTNANGNMGVSTSSNGNHSVHDRVYKDSHLWAMYLDLEESLGSVVSARAAYDRAMDLKVITVQMALNYTAFLREHEYFEDAFQVTERALALFEFPTVKPLFVSYLDAFIDRYAGHKMERLRGIFEDALARTSISGDDCVEFFIRYARAEEEFGLARHVTAIYDRAVKETKISDAQRLALYKVYVKKVEALFGVLKTRSVYDESLKRLPDAEAREICLEYAETETRLGEIDRARAIYQYGSQFADPKRYASYWQTWRDFETRHGSEETFKDLIKVQKSVALAFSGVSYLATDLLAVAASTANGSSAEERMQFAASSTSSALAANTRNTNQQNHNNNGGMYTAMDQLEAEAAGHIHDSVQSKKRPFDQTGGVEIDGEGDEEKNRKMARVVANREEIDI